MFLNFSASSSFIICYIFIRNNTTNFWDGQVLRNSKHELSSLYSATSNLLHASWIPKQDKKELKN